MCEENMERRSKAEAQDQGREWAPTPQDALLQPLPCSWSTSAWGFCGEWSWIKDPSLEVRILEEILSGTGQTRRKITFPEKQLSESFLGWPWFQLEGKKVFPENFWLLARPHEGLGPDLQSFHGPKNYKPQTVVESVCKFITPQVMEGANTSIPRRNTCSGPDLKNSQKHIQQIYVHDKKNNKP